MATKTQESEQYKTVTPARCRELLNELRGCIEQAQTGDEVALSKVREICKEAPAPSTDLFRSR